METQSIRLFVLAAEKGNITAAGRALGMGASVASTKLARLERSLGADLLHRSTRKVALSLEGAEFLPYAREILAQEDAALAAMGKTEGTATGTLRFAAPSSFAQLYIAPILPEFMERHPGVSLDLRLSDTQFDPIEGSFDLALRSSVLEDTSLKGRKLAEDPRILCAAPAYLQRYGTPDRPEDLVRHRLIGFQGVGARELLGPDGRTAAFEPRRADGRLIVDDGMTQALATVGGAGISANSLWCVAPWIAEGGLERVLPDYVVNDRSVLWLYYPKSNVLTGKVRIFIDFLLEKIGRAPPWMKN